MPEQKNQGAVTYMPAGPPDRIDYTPEVSRTQAMTIQRAACRRHDGRLSLALPTPEIPWHSRHLSLLTPKTTRFFKFSRRCCHPVSGLRNGDRQPSVLYSYSESSLSFPLQHHLARTRGCTTMAQHAIAMIAQGMQTSSAVSSLESKKIMTIQYNESYGPRKNCCGLKFALKGGNAAATLIYCSDSPSGPSPSESHATTAAIRADPLPAILRVEASWTPMQYSNHTFQETGHEASTE